jgi:branched-chain amino acid transport system substrate-binding protein
MKRVSKESTENGAEPKLSHSAEISRREFLKVAGIAGAAIGMGAGLGGLLAACGGGAEETTSTTGAATTQATTATTAAPMTTTTAAAAEMGREIKVGVVMPKTGALAAFGPADEWAANLTKEAIGDGIIGGDGKKHAVTFVLRDCQSDSNRAAQIAGDLITNDKVDILLGSVTPDVSNPAADQAEALAVPFLTSYAPWQAFIFGRGADLTKSFKWTYCHSMGTEQMGYSIMGAVDQIPNNKKVALITMNNPDGNAWLDENFGTPVAVKKYGYEMAATAQFNLGSEDFTKEIAGFKKAGADVLIMAMQPPDFTNFWKQSMQQGFQPKIPTGGLGITMPPGVAGVGDQAIGLIIEHGWTRDYPYIDPLTGMNCPQLSERWEKDTGLQEELSIGFLDKFAWTIDVLKRTTNVDDKETILEAIKTTKMESITGPIDFTAPIDADPLAFESFRPHPNVTKPVWTGAQWIKGTKWPVDSATVNNVLAPTVPTVPTAPYVYS